VDLYLATKHKEGCLQKLTDATINAFVKGKKPRPEDREQSMLALINNS
jgi:hypothetical protein